MSGLNNALSPRPTSRIQSTESMQTSSYEPESEESEFEDMSPNQERPPQASVCRDQEKDHLYPITPITESDILGASRNMPISPVLSYYSMKSDQSMKEPLKFNQGSDAMNRKIDPVSPAPTLGSVQSVQSMDPPHRFSGRESCTSLMMREHLRCSRCKYMLKEPVTIPCGHSFCKICIESFWSKIPPSENFPCPQCRKRFKSRPALNLNFTLANVVLTQQHALPALPQSDAGPGDVACDSCSGRKIKAVKSCLTCCMSFCETHVRQHYTEEALQRHILTDPRTNS
ncbi:uncharacterized protein LOC131349398 isoform X2 [Hemibagrus wyckioides]|nr:uncharacterized protein LOC131349398 isoform X2 [Hemibagrus wyckioides]XP_058241025.1 uncharacterized protein LOC131349398 isoform X2 [Hemibagrus wyckioides]